jgi:fibronectin-binding autotransporter adhesin
VTNSVITTASGTRLSIRGSVGTVNASGTVTGNGSAGALTLNSGSLLNIGNGGAGGTLTLSSLIINGGSTYSWNLNGGASNDLISVSWCGDLQRHHQFDVQHLGDDKRHHQLGSDL